MWKYKLWLIWVEKQNTKLNEYIIRNQLHRFRCTWGNMNKTSVIDPGDNASNMPKMYRQCICCSYHRYFAQDDKGHNMDILTFWSQFQWDMEIPGRKYQPYWRRISWTVNSIPIGGGNPGPWIPALLEEDIMDREYQTYCWGWCWTQITN